MLFGYEFALRLNVFELNMIASCVLNVAIIVSITYCVRPIRVALSFRLTSVCCVFVFVRRKKILVSIEFTPGEKGVLCNVNTF